jgi:hypothetical protein
VLGRSKSTPLAISLAEAERMIEEDERWLETGEYPGKEDDELAALSSFQSTFIEEPHYLFNIVEQESDDAKLLPDDYVWFIGKRPQSRLYRLIDVFEEANFNQKSRKEKIETISSSFGSLEIQNKEEFFWLLGKLKKSLSLVSDEARFDIFTLLMQNIKRNAEKVVFGFKELESFLSCDLIPEFTTKFYWLFEHSSVGRLMVDSRPVSEKPSKRLSYSLQLYCEFVSRNNLAASRKEELLSVLVLCICLTREPNFMRSAELIVLHSLIEKLLEVISRSIGDSWGKETVDFISKAIFNTLERSKANLRWKELIVVGVLSTYKLTGILKRTLATSCLRTMVFEIHGKKLSVPTSETPFMTRLFAFLKTIKVTEETDYLQLYQSLRFAFMMLDYSEIKKNSVSLSLFFFFLFFFSFISSFSPCRNSP